MKTFKKFILILPVMAFLAVASEQAQAQRRIIQLSGVVVGKDSTIGVPGVHVYVPKTGRGTISNSQGYFSMPVLVGDSVVISAVNYQKQHYIVPADEGERITLVVALLTNTIYLPIVEIFPYPTEKSFKAAILGLKLQDKVDESENLGEAVLGRMFRDMPMDGSVNHKYYMYQRFNRISTQFTDSHYNNPLFDPIKWSKFIKSIKRGDFKRKKEKK